MTTNHPCKRCGRPIGRDSVKWFERWWLCAECKAFSVLTGWVPSDSGVSGARPATGQAEASGLNAQPPHGPSGSGDEPAAVLPEPRDFDWRKLATMLAYLERTMRAKREAAVSAPHMLRGCMEGGFDRFRIDDVEAAHLEAECLARIAEGQSQPREARDTSTPPDHISNAGEMVTKSSQAASSPAEPPGRPLIDGETGWLRHEIHDWLTNDDPGGIIEILHGDDPSFPGKREGGFAITRVLDKALENASRVLAQQGEIARLTKELAALKEERDVLRESTIALAECGGEYAARANRLTQAVAAFRADVANTFTEVMALSILTKLDAAVPPTQETK